MLVFPNLVFFPNAVFIEKNRLALSKTEIRNYLYLLLHPLIPFDLLSP